MGVFVFVFAALSIESHSMLLGIAFWLMLLLLAFQSSFHDKHELDWRQHENKLALASSDVALGAWLLIPVAPWLIVGLLVLVPSLHRVVLWKMLRRQRLALGQHCAIWPGMAKKKSAPSFWDAIIFYAMVYDGIPALAFRHTLTKLNMDMVMALPQLD